MKKLEVIKIVIALCFSLPIVWAISVTHDRIQTEQKEVQDFNNRCNLMLTIEVGFGFTKNVYIDSLQDNGRYTELYQSGTTISIASNRIVSIKKQIR